MNLQKINHVYFIGIGGIGISAIAAMMLELGKIVYGSDTDNSPIIENLIKKGAIIRIGAQKAINIPKKIDLVIYTNALNQSNPELLKAKQLKITILKYSEFLAKLMHNYISIVVSGTHGKSTVTAMLAKIFTLAGLDPTVVVGTKVQEFNSNFRLGLGRYFIVEGDEYKDAFLQYQPIGLIINNIEADHLDYFKNINNIINSFKKIVKKIPLGGFLIVNGEDENIKKVIEVANCRIINFGLNHGNYYATHVIRHGELTRFAVKGLEQFDLAIRLPGLHNIQNALAASVMSLSFGINIEIIKKALLEYRGAWRRFEIKGEFNGITVIDDYAHHPTEIKATLKAARQFFINRRIWCIFQPHSSHRTESLFSDFVKSFDNCDNLILTDIYKVAGREKGKKFSIEKLQNAILNNKNNSILIKMMNKIPIYLKKNVIKGDVIIIMGAGDINNITNAVISNLKNLSL